MNVPSGPRFSLSVGEGEGSLLCLAGGDGAGGKGQAIYGSSTQQAVVVAYHLMRHGRVEREVLAAEFAALDGDDREPSVWRSLSEDMRRWLDSVREGTPMYSPEPSLDPAVRVPPIGLWYRRRPDELIEAVLESARVTHLDGPSVVSAAAVAAAVAASCFAQSGHDLMMAVADVALRAANVIAGESYRFSRSESLDAVVERVRASIQLVGSPLTVLAEELGPDPLGQTIAAVVFAANPEGDPASLVNTVADHGGRQMGAIAGAVVGARVGVRAWPWRIPNDTWFVALGRRLVEGAQNLEQLPVPYAVEQRLTYSPDSP